MPVTARDAAQDVIDRARGLLALDVAGTPDLVREDLRRSAHAFAVAALDTYFHWLVRGVDLDGTLPKHLAELKIDFGDLVESSKKSVTARQKGQLDRPLVRARNILNDALLTVTFQSPAKIELGLQMMGVKNCWGQISTAMVPAAPAGDLKNRLNEIVRRRNKIVHEGDLAQLVRPQRRINRSKLLRPDVDADILWLESLITAIESIR